MGLTTERQDGVVSIHIIGRLDGSNAIEFQESVRASVEVEDRIVIMDCSELGYISSSGLRTVLMVAKSLSNRNVRFALYAVLDNVLEVFEKSGFDTIIPIHASKEEALVSLNGP